jgi:hypothetical protein
MGGEEAERYMFSPRDNQGMWQIAAALESGQYVYKFGKEDVWSDMTYVGEHSTHPFPLLP